MRRVLVFRIALRWRRGRGGGRGGSGSGSFFRSPASTGWCWMATGRGRSIATARMPRASSLSVCRHGRRRLEPDAIESKQSPSWWWRHRKLHLRRRNSDFRVSGACVCWSSHACIKGRKVVGRRETRAHRRVAQSLRSSLQDKTGDHRTALFLPAALAAPFPERVCKRGKDNDHWQSSIGVATYVGAEPSPPVLPHLRQKAGRFTALASTRA